jgi:hypothetical protein
MTGQRGRIEEAVASTTVRPTTLLALVALDHRNQAQGPVWTAEAGAIVLLLNGRRSVLLPEVVS